MKMKTFYCALHIFCAVSSAFFCILPLTFNRQQSVVVGDCLLLQRYKFQMKMKKFSRNLKRNKNCFRFLLSKIRTSIATQFVWIIQCVCVVCSIAHFYGSNLPLSTCHSQSRLDNLPEKPILFLLCRRIQQSFFVCWYFRYISLTLFCFQIDIFNHNTLIYGSFSIPWIFDYILSLSSHRLCQHQHEFVPIWIALIE